MTCDPLFRVPEILNSDPFIKHLLKQREQAHTSFNESNEMLKRYVLLNSSQLPEDLLPSLTKLQSRTIDFIAEKYLSSGQSPTSQEICKRLRWKSINSAVHAVNALHKKGYLHKVKGRWRSLVPLFDSHRNRISQSKHKSKSQ